MEAWGPPLPPEGFQPIWVFSRPPAFPLVPLPSSPPPADEGVKLPICHLLQAATLSLPLPPALPPPWQPAGGDPWLWKCILGVVRVPFSRVRVPRGAVVSRQAKIPFSPLRFANFGARNFWHGSQQHDLEFSAIEFLHAAIIAHFWAVACSF